MSCGATVRPRLAALPLLLAAARAAGSACGGACLQREDSLLQLAKRLAVPSAAGGIGGEPEAPPGSREEVVRVEHHQVGCFPRSPGDDPDEGYEYEDKTCVRAGDFTAESPCRSGLPFFRLRLRRDQSALDCSRFCLSKGLDLSGLTAGPRSGEQECRCGATPENRVAWHGRTPPSSLLLPLDRHVPIDDPHCEVLVWRYAGGMVDDGVPYALTELSVSDVQYMDEIAESMQTVRTEDISNVVDLHAASEAQRDVTVHVDPSRLLDEVRVQGGVSLLSAKGLCSDSSDKTGIIDGSGRDLPCSEARNWCNASGDLGPAVQKSCPLSCGVCDEDGGWLACYPSSCGPGGGPWMTKQGDTVKINFYYDSNIDQGRKDAWILATKIWEDNTCIEFTESSQTPCIKVGITDPASCSAIVGYPGDDGEGKVNLGWCSDTRHVGNIAHEIGHVLGMNHEQSRPDAGESYETPEGPKGPYLQIFWQNIAAEWKPQFKPDEKSYIGSETRQYAAYDYASIMHYPANDNFQVIDPLFRSLPGSRSALSEGDIAQFEDMYQCNGAGGPSPAAQPTPAPTPAPTPGPAPSGCEDSTENPWGQSCAAWLAQGACATSDGIREHCKVSCQQCTPGDPAPTPGPAPSGCEDSTENPWGQSCAAWLAQGACATSNGIREHCKVSCQQCTP